MPSDPAGNYSLPPSYRAVAGSTIRTEQHNPPLEDLAQAMSQRLMRDGRNGMLGDLNMGGFALANVHPSRLRTSGATVSQTIPIGSIVDYAGMIAPAGWLFCAGQAISRADHAELFAALGTAFGAGNNSTTFNLPDLRGRVTAGRDDMDGTDAGRLSAFFGAVARSVGGVLGAASHVLTLGQLAAHAHAGTTAASGSHNHAGSTQAAGAHSHTGATDTQGQHVHGIAVNNNANAGLNGVRGGNTGPMAVSQDSQPAGAHAHNLAINGVGDHGHGILTDGNHTHGFTTNTHGNNEAHPNAQPTMILNKIIRVSYAG